MSQLWCSFFGKLCLSPDRPGSTCCAQIYARKNLARYLAHHPASSRSDGRMYKAVASRLRKKQGALSSLGHPIPSCSPAKRPSNASSGTANQPLAAFLESASEGSIITSLLPFY